MYTFRDVFCAGRVTEEDMNRTLKACGGALQSTSSSLKREVLGNCESFEEVQIGGERCEIFICELLNIIQWNLRITAIQYTQVEYTWVVVYSGTCIIRHMFGYGIVSDYAIRFT